MKKCPVCAQTFESIEIEEGLPASRCSGCGGMWVSSKDYFPWMEPKGDVSPERLEAEAEFPLPVVNRGTAILCPDCGRILLRFKVWPDTAFHLDRCGACNGIWFDRDEWQVLKSLNLHRKVRVVFSDGWQQKLRSVEMRRRLEKMYETRFGAEDYARIMEIRAWLHGHSEGSSLLAYLTAREPYQA